MPGPIRALVRALIPVPVTVRAPPPAGASARAWARRRGALVLAAVLAGVLGVTPARAAPLRVCEEPAELDVDAHDTLFRFAEAIRATLRESGAALALVARSGLDLRRFGQRYSHGGIALRDSPNAPWSVRQLYYDCGERRPRLFDEGIAGFVSGSGDPTLRYFSVVLLPREAAARVEAPLAEAAIDRRRALGLLGATYSANAYAYGRRYQNCNQWVAELIGVAWGGLPDGPDVRERAQAWLHDAGYAPTVFEVRNPLFIAAAAALPHLHVSDHPEADLAAGRFRVSMPEAISGFVRERVPQARRVEFCHTATRIVVREGWEPIETGCVPRAGDRVVPLDR